MSPASEAREFRALTFDCYGTLIDWEGGVAQAAAKTASLAGCDMERLVRERESIECELEAGPYRPYGEILAETLRRAASLQGRDVSQPEAEDFAESMAAWSPFPDAGPALRRLAARYRLAILSNVETRILVQSVRALDAPFELLVTAEQVRSYKPARAHFDAALERLRLQKEQVLHVAVSEVHDLRPAGVLGWKTAWVNRKGLTRPPDVAPLWTVPDLAALAEILLA